jgi:hypothetical protein
MLQDLYDAIVADGRNYDALEISDSSIFISEGEGVAVLITVESDKFHMSFNAGHKEESADKTTITEVIEELNNIMWDASDWF